jgi:hypothetical protein
MSVFLLEKETENSEKRQSVSQLLLNSTCHQRFFKYSVGSLEVTALIYHLLITGCVHFNSFNHLVNHNLFVAGLGLELRASGLQALLLEP